MESQIKRQEAFKMRNRLRCTDERKTKRENGNNSKMR